MKCDIMRGCKECPHYLKNIELTKIRDVARKAATLDIIPEDRVSGMGCGRIYITGMKIRKNSKIAKVLTGEGFRLTERPYTTGLSIYIGYDNSTGHQHTLGRKVARIFNENNICCGCEGDGD